MHFALNIVGLVAVVGFVAAAARRWSMSEPLVLVVVGIALSFVPHVLEIKLTPDLVLFGLLPPLLYAAAIRTSLVDFRRNRRAILLLSVNLVILTTVAVGLVSWWLIPGIGGAAAFAIGAVVAPPDAVAATTVARNVGMPRQIVSILEGESLLNDATALVMLNTAIGAIIHHEITPWRVVGDFVLAAGGGVVVGVVVALLLAQIRRRIDDPVLDTTLSFAAPFVAFLPAEEVHASGVLAVVITGLYLGHESPKLQSAASRISENINWRTVQFVLENVVFLLIGLQIRSLIEGVNAHGPAWHIVIPACVAVLAATIASRVLINVVINALSGLLHTKTWSWPETLVVSWAGMRGVVTLAAAFLLPEQTPHRDMLRLVAFVVVAGTLLIQGVTLPLLVRRLGLRGPDLAEDALQAASLVTAAAQEGLDVLERSITDDDPPEIIDQLRERAMRRTNQIWERLGRPNDQVEPPMAAYRRLRMKMLAAERGSLLEARDSGNYDDEVLRTALAAIDTEESTLDRIEDASNRVGEELTTDEARSGDCEHLRDAPRVVAARTPEGCEECLRDGMRWVHLRLCLSCGHVGCCDSSIGKHATAHFHDTQHPVMRSIEPGEAWRWCFVDNLTG